VLEQIYEEYGYDISHATTREAILDIVRWRSEIQDELNDS
jgi:hypothetical protein